jgi:cell division protein FtsQ
VLFSSYVTAEQVQVSGNGAVGVQRIERAARVPLGTPLARVDLDAIARRVEAIPAVRTAEVSRSWPHGVHITVVERTPVAVIDRGSGLMAMDSRGVLFGGYGSRPRGLPLVKAPAGTGAEALQEAARVIAALPADIARKVDYLEAATVDQITLVLRNGRTVLWGSVDGSRQKAEVLAVLLKRPGQRIDVSVPGRPTTK